jgi:hypothetical protein
MNCPKCDKLMMGIEYSYDHPEHYDGISEWKCCGLRIGRWSKKILTGNEVELKRERYAAN